MEYVGNPWDRQTFDGEPEPMTWYDLFDRYYRPQGPRRTLIATYNAWRAVRGKPDAERLPDDWTERASEFCWKERAEEWDVEQLRLRRIEEEKQLRDMHKRHICLAIGLQAIGSKKLKMLQKDPEKLTDAEGRRYVKEGIGLERQARGLPEHLLTITRKSNDELLAGYSRLLERVGDIRSGDEEAWTEASETDEPTILQLPDAV